MSSSQSETGFQILAAVGDEDQLESLLLLGCSLAASKGGKVILLSVTASGRRPSWLSVPEVCGQVPVDVVVRTGRDAGDEILTVARDEQPDLILLGWRGASGRGRYLLGSTLDPVVQFAPCGVLVVRAQGGQRALKDSLPEVQRVLVPAAGGPNAALAIDLALSLSPQTQVTAINVAREVQGNVALSLGRERLDEALEMWADEPRVQGKIVQSASVVKGILTEATKGYDLVMIGASHESYLDRVLFGNVPQMVASHSPVPAIVVKQRVHRLRVGAQLRRAGWRLFGVLPTLELREQTDVYKSVREGAQPKVDFFVMIALSAAIATLGLLQNSPAVIIGAMLVAPLMAAIFGLGLGVVRGDVHLLKRAVSALLRGVFLAIGVAVLLTLMVPQRTLASEITGRAVPTLLDLGVALASGAAGAYAMCRKGVSASLPGVAIAAALVPPLSVIGIGLAEGRWDIAGGALLLFTTNLVAISAASGMVFLWLGFRPLAGKQERRMVFRGGVLGVAVLLVVITALLGVLTVGSVRESVLRRNIEHALTEEIANLPLVTWDGEWLMEKMPDGSLQLDVSVRSRRTVRYDEVVALQEALASDLNMPVSLVLSVIPSTQLDPLVPPTHTPTPLPGATATFTPSPTWTSTAIPSRTPTSTPTTIPTDTPTPTWTPTYTPEPTATPTFTPTPTPTPTPMLAEVGGTGGQGVWMYRAPGFDGGKITAWRDGTVFTLSGEVSEADGYVWTQVVDPKGRLGWIPEPYLIQLERPPR